MPRAWTEFIVRLRYFGTRYEIAFENPLGVNKGLVTLQLDGAELSAQTGLVPLVDDGATHRIRAVLGSGLTAHPPNDIANVVGD